MTNQRVEQNESWLAVNKMLPLLAGIFIAFSILLPFWRVDMKAPQYPEKTLTIKIFANKMVGDIWEVNTLNQYAGVKFPENLPEFKMFPPILGVIALFNLAAAFASKKLRKILLPIVVAVLFIFLTASLADLQWRLYEVGHNLDPHAPMAGFKEFTPPILGPNKIANFHTLALFGSGGVAIGLAFVFNFIAFMKRNSAVTINEWGKKLSHMLDS
ncbi:MAG: hypothetical protein ROZ36_19375 [Thermincola sp.]|jgi:hypothetical protein|nr:hypothetical protein [Thermincola sp.]